jgi:hypothetical protein
LLGFCYWLCCSTCCFGFVLGISTGFSGTCALLAKVRALDNLLVNAQMVPSIVAKNEVFFQNEQHRSLFCFIKRAANPKQNGSICFERFASDVVLVHQAAIGAVLEHRQPSGFVPIVFGVEGVPRIAHLFRRHDQGLGHGGFDVSLPGLRECRDMASG